MTKSITEKTPNKANALDARAAVFADMIAHGIAGPIAAHAAGYADPASASRRLLRRADIQAEIQGHIQSADISLSGKARVVLMSLMDSALTPATVKARIAIDLMKLDTKTGPARTPENTPISDLELMRAISDLQSRLGVRAPNVIAAPNAGQDD